MSGKCGAVHLGRRQTLANGLFPAVVGLLLNSGDSGSLALQPGLPSRHCTIRPLRQVVCRRTLIVPCKGTPSPGSQGTTFPRFSLPYGETDAIFAPDKLSMEGKPCYAPPSLP